MMGIRRKIDFIFVSRAFEVISGEASKEIDLGSDHRAVKSVVRTKKRIRQYLKSNPSLKNWTPQIGPSGRAEKFEAVLLEKMDGNICGSTEDLSNLLYEAAVEPGVQVEVPEKCKPWQLDEIKILIQERRNCTTLLEKRRISK